MDVIVRRLEVLPPSEKHLSELNHEECERKENQEDRNSSQRPLMAPRELYKR